MSYYDKYLLYKKKYLSLKVHHGGAASAVYTKTAYRNAVAAGVDADGMINHRKKYSPWVYNPRVMNELFEKAMAEYHENMIHDKDYFTHELSSINANIQITMDQLTQVHTTVSKRGFPIDTESSMIADYLNRLIELNNNRDMHIKLDNKYKLEEKLAEQRRKEQDDAFDRELENIPDGGYEPENFLL
jgi:hypothetical protein